MTGNQRWVLGHTSLAWLMVALDALIVSTALSRIRPRDLTETRAAISDRIDRSSEST
jgi:hypothetical protein